MASQVCPLLLITSPPPRSCHCDIRHTYQHLAIISVSPYETMRLYSDTYFTNRELESQRGMCPIATMQKWQNSAQICHGSPPEPAQWDHRGSFQRCLATARPPSLTWPEEVADFSTETGPAWNRQVTMGGHTVQVLPATDNPAQKGKLLASWKKRGCFCSHRALLEADLEGDQVKDSFPG